MPNKDPVRHLQNTKNYYHAHKEAILSRLQERRKQRGEEYREKRRKLSRKWYHSENGIRWEQRYIERCRMANQDKTLQEYLEGLSVIDIRSLQNPEFIFEYRGRRNRERLMPVGGTYRRPYEVL